MKQTTLIGVYLFAFLATQCFCLEDKAINQVSSDAMVRKAKLLAAEYEKLAILIQGDEVSFTPNSTKDAVSFYMDIIDGANSAVSLSNEIDPSIIPPLNAVKNSLKNNIKQLHNALSVLNEEIHDETAQVIVGEYLTQFNQDIVGTVDEILYAFDSYLLERNETNEQLLHESCFKLTSNDTLAHMTALLEKSAEKNLENDNFSDKSFDALNSLFSKLIAEISVFYPQCYFIETNSVLEHEDLHTIKDYVQNLVETLAEINENREIAYFSETVVSGILEKHLSNTVGKYLREIAKNIANEFEEKYQSINEKNEYKYSVVVYKDVQGYGNHAVSGDTYRHLFHHNNKNVIVFRGHAKNGTECEALDDINYKNLSGCSKNLSVVSNKVIERCPSINNAAFITFRASPEFYPENLDWMGYKKVSMNGCWFIKNRAMFYSYN